MIDNPRICKLIKLLNSDLQAGRVERHQNGSKKKEESIKVCDFEEAISASGFGKFNIIVLLCSLPGFMTATYVTSILSYVTTSAECDLELSMTQMGTLTIIPYCGMLCSAMIWGFLSDTLGRKKIMVWGYLCLALSEFMSSFSQEYWMLVLFKFITGFVFNGPFAVLVSYLSELHAAPIRSKILIYSGIFYGLANINLPLIAWSIIPNQWDIPLFGETYRLHSWHIFLALFTIPPMLSGILIAFLPESPKFLMSRGRNEEALKVFQTIYSMNTRNSPEMYPVKSLVMELGEGQIAPRGLEALQKGFSQFRPLCRSPHLLHIFVICLINFGAMMGGNTLRLWFPQMATIIEDYNSKNTETASLCEIISTHVSNKTLLAAEINYSFTDCVVMETGSDTYINSIIIGAGTLIVYPLGGYFINIIGKRKISALSLLINAVTCISLYWSSTWTEIVSLFTIFVSASTFTGTAISCIAVDLFPTSLRAMAVALFFMMGRLGSIVGGLTFSSLLNIGCIAPFIFISALMLNGCWLCFVLPKTTLKKLE